MLSINSVYKLIPAIARFSVSIKISSDKIIKIEIAHL